MRFLLQKENLFSYLSTLWRNETSKERETRFIKKAYVFLKHEKRFEIIQQNS